jgi:hypothetical protein
MIPGSQSLRSLGRDDARAFVFLGSARVWFEGLCAPASSRKLRRSVAEARLSGIHSGMVIIKMRALINQFCAPCAMRVSSPLL